MYLFFSSPSIINISNSRLCHACVCVIFPFNDMSDVFRTSSTDERHSLIKNKKIHCEKVQARDSCKTFDVLIYIYICACE